jgi:hypothetical protein
LKKTVVSKEDNFEVYHAEDENDNPFSKSKEVSSSNSANESGEDDTFI